VLKKIIIIGAGGHSKVIADIVLKNRMELLGFLDDNIVGNILGYKILGKVKDIVNFSNEAAFIVGIGNNYIRKEITETYDVQWYTAIHPSACIGEYVSIDEGTVIMANATINTGTSIGKHCIINTGAIIEHDNILEDYVHISPGTCLGGTVKVGKYSHIGIGAVVKNNINIIENCIVGAGAVVVKDIIEKGVYIGRPAKKVPDGKVII
jgi:sugar O-acyltransferase (sialic acid O-acetyltransferase NeuD family)